MAIKVHIPADERVIIGPGRRINCPEEVPMGEVRIEVDLENAVDRELVYRGQMAATEVRAARVRVLADTGAIMTMLPQEIVEALELRELRKVVVINADERKEERPIAGMVTVRVGNRELSTECIVGPPGSEPLLGQIPLEAMDLLVDCGHQQLVPRPESPFLPLLNMK